MREVATIPADEVMMTCVTMGYPDDGLPPMRCARAASTIRSLYPTSALPMSTTKEIILCGIFLVPSRPWPLAISNMQEEQYAD
ncbi:hypothetical protein BCCGELA001_17535 [Bradyrhizobium sp. CCGE-LA001]|nr:hypothetical protein BCCGELA001_17535 [Bradyrhizobium sp. CCGE-LA001]